MGGCTSKSGIAQSVLDAPAPSAKHQVTVVDPNPHPPGSPKSTTRFSFSLRRSKSMSEALHSMAFQSINHEVTKETLRVASGKVPRWLDGVLFRNGPAQWEAGSGSISGWSDGYAMLQSFVFFEGEVWYSNKFLNSKALTLQKEVGSFASVGFHQAPKKKDFKKLTLGKWEGPPPRDNASLNVVKIEGSVVALGEGTMVEVDSLTLSRMETGGLDFSTDNIKGHLDTTHPHVDTEGSYWGHTTFLGKKSYYNIYKIPTGKRARQVVAKISASPPCYMHSFAISKNHIILIQSPLVINVKSWNSAGGPKESSIGSHLTWKPSHGTTFTVVNTETGQVVGERTCEAFFYYHIINAFETTTGESNCIFVDVVAYDDASVLKEFSDINMLRRTFKNNCEVRRYVLILDKGSKHATYRLLYPETFEMPAINYQLNNGRDYNYIYGLTRTKSNPNGLYNEITKINVEDKADVRQWSEPGCFPGEPMLVPIPAAAKFLGDSLWDMYNEMAEANNSGGCFASFNKRIQTGSFISVTDENYISRRGSTDSVGSSGRRSVSKDPGDIYSSPRSRSTRPGAPASKSGDTASVLSAPLSDERKERRKTVKFRLGSTHKTNREDEDDGVVMSVVIKPETSSSFLVILEGKSLLELARVELPHAVPMDAHGIYLYRTELHSTLHHVLC